MGNLFDLDFIQRETVRIIDDTPPYKLKSALIKFVQDSCLRFYKMGYRNAKQNN